MTNYYPNKLDQIDVNHPQFYDKLQDEIETDLAKLKNNVSIVKNLRLDAAEMEVETAALYHAELWHDIEALKKTIMCTMTADDAIKQNK